MGNPSIITYKEIMTKEVPEYLRRKKKEKERRTIARYRCGNEMREGQHWREEDKRICRVCRKEKENLSLLTLLICNREI